MKRNTADPSDQHIVIRRSVANDRDAIDRLAILAESRTRPWESFVAEVDGQIVAAVSVDGAIAIANPFVRTAALVAVLRDRVEASAGPRITVPRRRLAALRLARR